MSVYLFLHIFCRLHFISSHIYVYSYMCASHYIYIYIYIQLGLSLTSEHNSFYKHIYSRLTTHIQSGRQSIFLLAGDTFCFGAFVRYFRSLISRSSHFSFQCIKTNGLIDLSAGHLFPISASLCHLYPLSFLLLRHQSF